MPTDLLDRVTVFDSTEVLNLEEGGEAHVTIYGLKESGACRVNVHVTPGALLTDRDVGILAGLLLKASFSPPLKDNIVCELPPT